MTSAGGSSCPDGEDESITHRLRQGPVLQAAEGRAVPDSVFILG